MERRAAVTANRPMCRFAALVAVLLLCGPRTALAADRLVLVVSANAPVTALNSLEVQKLFLGLTVASNGVDLHPLLNESDEAIRQLFYQDVVSMSEPVYERRLLALTLQQGRTAPPVYRDSRALLNAVAADGHAISYVWASEAARDGRVRILKFLGRE